MPGDPIEVGSAINTYLAKSTAFGSSNSAPAQAPCLRMLANKTILGHAEPAAGLLGLAYAAHQMHQSTAAPLLHLRQVNPHVVSVMESAGLPAGSLHASRQLAPMPQGSALVGSEIERCAVGASAFAFQVGTLCMPHCTLIYLSYWSHCSFAPLKQNIYITRESTQWVTCKACMVPTQYSLLFLLLYVPVNTPLTSCI